MSPEQVRVLERGVRVLRLVAREELEEREHRHSQFELKAIPPENRERYRAEWNRVQERFVDEPAEAVAEADRLVNVVVSDLGYPAEGYDRQLADLSVQHAHTVEHYRTAHDAHVRDGVSTDDLRKALLSYRKVFDELLDNGAGQRHAKNDKTERIDQDEAVRG